MIGSIASIVPPIIAIVMVLLTKRVILSLGFGILSAAILISLDGHSFFTVLGKGMIASLWDGEAFNWSNIFIMLFILLLGIITAFVSLSGGTRAFADWATRRVKTRRGAKLLTVFLGLLFFIDDYFNALAVGQIARPISDKQRVSRAQLAYFIDSTSAPICVVSPISSWGAFLIGQLAPILGAAAIVTYSPLSAFVLMAPMNFYVVATLIFVFYFAWTNVSFGGMRDHEMRAIETGELYDASKDIPGELKEDFPEHSYGRVRDLVLPIVVLIFVTFTMMFITGARASGSMSIWAIFEETDVPLSLAVGGVIGASLAVALYVGQMKKNETASWNWVGTALKTGLQSMAPAVLILFFAWALTDFIGTLETGSYLASIVEQTNVSPAFLPLVLFIFGGLIAFSTGTSWGSFGILLPIAADVMIATDVSLLLPAMSAVLAGAVFGDHCSPISDTTILSATGAGCNHIDHVSTQLPYAILSALVAGFGYLVFAFTTSIVISLIALLIVMVIVLIVLSKRNKMPVAL